MKRPIAEWRKDLVKPATRKRRERKVSVPVKVMRDGREICDRESKAGRDNYQLRLVLMAIRQNHLCGLCGKWMNAPSFDHENGRGAGKRDDRIEVNGIWQNAAMHLFCNVEKGSRRIPYLPHARNTEQGKMRR